MDKEQFKEDIYYWIGFMLTSALALDKEPSDYGVIRLLDSTERLITILEKHGLADSYLSNLCQQLRDENTSSVNLTRRKEVVRKLTQEYTQELLKIIEQIE